MFVIKHIIESINNEYDVEMIIKIMSRTKKDYKKNKKWDNRTHEFRSGVKKWWRRLSNKLGRKTPVEGYINDYHYDEDGNLIDKNVASIENTPRRGDKWDLN